MEKLTLTLQSEKALSEYLEGRWLMRNEREIGAELLEVIKNKDEVQLDWFDGFGEDFRQIFMNVREYRKGLEFGFTEIAFRTSGWFSLPKFLDFEEIKIEQSKIRLGHGPNGLWTYALSCSYGAAGSSGPLSVFGKQYPNRAAAMTAALEELKEAMRTKVGNSDHTNYHQDLISRTLKAITAAQIGLVQLSLF